MRVHLAIAIALLLISTTFGAPRVNRRFDSIGGICVNCERQSQEDVWAVIELPAGEELTLELAPTSTMPTAKGTARVLRSSIGTEINLEASGLTMEVEAYHAFAIDSLGNASTLGRLTVQDGAGTLRAQSALTQFMILVSAKEDVVTLTSDTHIVLRSKAPAGYKIVSRVNPETNNETKSATSEPENRLLPDYDVPLLGIGTLKRGSTSQMKARLFDELQGSRINASLTPSTKGFTQVNFAFRDLKLTPGSRHYIVWAVGPDNAYSALGAADKAKQGKLNAVVEFSDFGLFITIEESDSPILPTGKMVAMIVR